MVAGGVDVVDTDGVGANVLHKTGVELALGVVDERVVGDELVGDSCITVKKLCQSNLDKTHL